MTSSSAAWASSAVSPIPGSSRSIRPWGTGTYLHAVLERIAANAAAQDGPGAVSGAVTRAAERIAGFELQTGPYAVAELRATEQLNRYQAVPPDGGLKLFVTDTLDDPNAAETQFRSALQLIAASRRRADEIKARANVTVVIGNPPYAELANGTGGWSRRAAWN